MSKKLKIAKYPKLRDNLRSYDVLDCRSYKFPFSFIGHTAMIYVEPHTGQVGVLESTTLNNPDAKYFAGVQLTPMGKWLTDYKGKVRLRKFIPMFKDDANRAVRQLKLAKFVKKYLGTSYPNLKTYKGLRKLFFAWWDGFFTGKNKNDDSTNYCTELVARAFKNAKYMSPDTNPSEFIPGDITRDNGKFHKQLLNCRLSMGFRIK